MSSHKFIRFAAGVCLLAALSTGNSHGQGSYLAFAATNQAPGMVTSLKSEEVSGASQVRRAYTTFGTNMYAFIVPQSFRLDASDSEKIMLIHQDSNIYLTFRVIPFLAIETADPYKKMVLKRYPTAKILEEFSQSTAGHSGPAYDLQFANSSGTPQSARIAYIPSQSGVWEFCLLANSEKFSNGLYFFNSLLLTFRSNEGGKLVVPRLSDKF